MPKSFASGLREEWSKNFDECIGMISVIDLNFRIVRDSGVIPSRLQKAESGLVPNVEPDSSWTGTESAWALQSRIIVLPLIVEGVEE